MAGVEEAIAALREALAERPDDREALTNLANALAFAGRFEEAAPAFARAVQAGAAEPQLFSNFGYVLMQLGRPDEAIVAYEAAIAAAPGFAKAHANLANALQAQARYAAALAAYDRAVALQPTLAEAWSNRGMALLGLERSAEALESFDRALALRADYVEAHVNRAVALTELQRLDEAVQACEQALALAPGHSGALFNRSFAWFLMGDLPRGFAAYEERWSWGYGLGEKRGFTQPKWTGEADIAGKTVLVHYEQGYGDTLQFCRYVPLLEARGARVILEVQPRLKALFAHSFPEALVLAQGEALPPFDFYCPIMTLGLAFRTTIDTIPTNVPYLQAPPDSLARWRERVGPAEGRRIGVVWAGHPETPTDGRRSMPLSTFLKAFPEDIELVALQTDLRDGDAEILAQTPRLRFFGPELQSFADTAAVATLVDQVVTVDSSPGHLSGALGKTVWTLLSYVPDWRWLEQREDSPWYPNTRLFRQPAVGDWDTVVTRVRAALG